MDNRKELVESYNIRRLRANYLLAIAGYRAKGRPIIYLDETYIHASHTPPMGWYGANDAGVKTPISKGRRLIVVHAGGEMDFVANALLIFISGARSGDYHQEMTHLNFMQWVETQLLPNLPANSVVVCDNASYYNVQSAGSITMSTKKADMLS